MGTGTQVERLGRSVGPRPEGRRLSRGAQRLVRLGELLPALGKLAAMLLVATSLAFACLLGEPIYYRVCSVIVLGVIPGLLTCATGRVLGLCLIAAALMYDPTHSALTRVAQRAAVGAVRLGCLLGHCARVSAGAVLRSRLVEFICSRCDRAPRATGAISLAHASRKVEPR